MEEKKEQAGVENDKKLFSLFNDLFSLNIEAKNEIDNDTGLFLTKALNYSIYSKLITEN